MHDLTTAERFYAKINFEGPTADGLDSGCWVWTAGKFSNRYGAFWDGSRGMVQAHRFAYELIRGPIPKELVVDHLCRVTHCVNPDHLELVSPSVNSQRQGVSSQNTSGVRGVSWNRDSKKWRVQVQPRVNGKQRFISGGRFDDLADAEEAAIALRAKVFGPDAEREARLEVDKARGARAARSVA